MGSNSLKSQTKRKSVKIIYGIAGLGILILLIIVVSTSGSKPKSTTVSSTTPKTTTTKATPATTPTVALATLNAQAVPILTTATMHFTDLFATVQQDSQQSNAANSTSDFAKQWRSFQTTPDNSMTTAYNNASNLYFNGHQAAPDAISNWNNDISQVESDITTWTNDQEQLFADQATGNDTTSAQAKVTTALNAYNSDVAKAKADISQL